MRHDVREEVKQVMYDDLKPNFAAIARQYGADYRTVKQAFTELNKEAKLKKLTQETSSQPVGRLSSRDQG